MSKVQSSDNNILFGSVAFVFSGIDRTSYDVYSTFQFSDGSAGFKMYRVNELGTHLMGWYDTVEDAVRDALSVWEFYIVKGEMPIAEVDGMIDPWKVSDYMLDIQEGPEEPEDDEPEVEGPFEVEPVGVDPLVFAIRTLEDVAVNLSEIDNSDYVHHYLGTEIDQIESALEFLKSIAYPKANGF